MSKLDLDFNEDNKYFVGNKVFLAIGRLSIEKDHEKMIRAFEKVIKQSSSKNIKLLILGGGPQQLHLENLIKELNVVDNVKLLGVRDNPYAYIEKSDCFLSSSNHEGQPMTLFEALILKKDIIATNITGNRAVLEGRGGVLVENSVEGLTQGIIEYINNVEKQEHTFNIEEYNKNAIDGFYNLF